jgi:hypothetical protein
MCTISYLMTSRDQGAEQHRQHRSRPCERSTLSGEVEPTAPLSPAVSGGRRSVYRLFRI